jgi:putative transposase
MALSKEFFIEEAGLHMPMKRKRFSVEQVVAVLKQAEVGVAVAELIRQVGSPSRLCIAGRSSTRDWKPIRSASSNSSRKRMARLKRLVAELTLDKVKLQDVLAKNCDALAPPPGGELLARHLPGERAACVPCGRVC